LKQEHYTEAFICFTISS